MEKISENHGNPRIRVFDQLRPFFDMCSTQTLHDFCCRVQLESFGQGLVDFIGFHPLDKAIYAKI